MDPGALADARTVLQSCGGRAQGGPEPAARSQTCSLLCLVRGSRRLLGCAAGCACGADPCASASGPSPRGRPLPTCSLERAAWGRRSVTADLVFQSAAWSGQRGGAGASPLTWLGTADTGRPAESCLQRDACSERVAHGSLRARQPERAGHRRPSGSSPRRGAFGGPSGPPAGRRCLLRNVRREALA